MTVGLVTPETDDFAAKAAAYRSDVTYGTNTEMGFDYLRDNMAARREHHGPVGRARLRVVTSRTPS